MSWIEWIAAGFGRACVALTIYQSVWCWPTGLVQVALYVWVFFQAKLYSDVILHVIYVGLGIYGWYHWVRGRPREGERVPISRLSPAAAGVWFTFAASATMLWGLAMSLLTDAALPFWDAAIAVFSLVAQYLLARKVLENWLVWIAVDVVAIGVYFAKGLYVTTGLYLVFLGMAAAGWLAWQKSFKAQQAREGPPPRGFEVVMASSSESSSPRTAGTSS